MDDASDPSTTSSPLASVRHCAEGPQREGEEGAWPSDLPPPSPPPLSSPPAPRAGADVAGKRRRSCGSWRPTPRPTVDPSRRDPRRAELFRRLIDTAPDEQTSPEEEGEGEENPDHGRTTCPPRTAVEMVYKYLRAFESTGQANHVLGSNENSISATTSKNNQKMLCDIDGDQCNVDQHSFKSTSREIVLHKNNRSDRWQDEQGAHNLLPGPSNPSQGGLIFQVFVVQCWNCTKLRITPTQEKYEEIRERITKEHFVCKQACEWKPNVTCDDPTDISLDDIWALDKHGIAQPPPDWKRLIKIRNEGTTRFADVYYICPNGLKFRSGVQVEKYLSENPIYAQQGVDISRFSFAIPAPYQQDYIIRHRPRSSPSEGDHPLQSEVLPLAWAVPPVGVHLPTPALLLGVPSKKRRVTPSNDNEDSPTPTLLLGVPSKKRSVAQSKGV
ncbi:hypothetical protein GUJ93_ZPchr0010g9803 [Zizania palustris]|uniref:Methyl-CpG-binding domain-containing protein 2 n=1 Tax=Zizania palustris TaxID=103762 RepID=A0A8J5WDU3_ZIZPA|nr:hypothetical protein GUJ93_ZPchr0010g9803 [Zizania palustris]